MFVIGYDLKPVDDVSFTNTPTSYSAKSRSSLSTLGSNVQLSSILVASNSETVADNRISLTVNPNVFKSGVSYRLRLNATNTDGYSNTAEIDINTESEPTSGRLLVVPNIGKALNTTFTITAVDWTDHFGDPPLLYQFGFRLSQQSTKIYWLSPIKFNSQILSFLPIMPSNGSIMLVLRVYDRSAAFTTHEVNFSGITTATQSQYDAQTFISLIREQATKYGRVNQGLASLTAVVASVSEYSSKFMNEATFRSDAVDFLLDISQQVNSTKSSLNQILFLLEHVTNGISLGFATQQRLAAFLEHIIEKYQTFQDNFVFSTPGFNPDEAAAVFTLYGRMLGGTTRLEINRVSQSYLSTIIKLSHGICRQLGLNEEIVLTEEMFGSLKLSYYTPANQFTASCVNNENNRCPFSQNSAVDIDFRTTLFNRYISWQCQHGFSCSGVCLTSIQLLRNILWDGNPYLRHTKSSSLSLYVVNPVDGGIEPVEGLSQPVKLQFPVTPSNSTLQCVYWDVRERRWSTRGCSTSVVRKQVITHSWFTGITQAQPILPSGQKFYC